MRDLFLEQPKSQRRETVWHIRDLNGNLVAEHVRVDGPQGKRIWWRRNGKKGLNGLSTRELPLYGAELLPGLPNGTTVVICEGEKAADAVCKAGTTAVGTVTGAATIPKRTVLEPLVRFDVVLWPDNDPQGKDHMERIAQELMAMGVKPRWVDWPDAPPKGDAADADPKQIRELVDKAQPYKTSTGSLAQAREAVQKWLELPDLDVVDLILATVVANANDGDPVWILLVGPSSSAKSELIRAVADLPQCYRLASLTGRTLVSGHKDADGGLLFRIPDRSTLVLLDFGQVLSLHPNDKALVLQRLREIYDGYTKGDYGNRADGLEWRGKLGFLAGATPAIEKFTSVGAELGDRFLFYRIHVLKRKKQALGAIAKAGTEKQMRTELTRAFERALRNAGDPTMVEVPQEIREAIATLATFTTRLRTPVSRDRYSRDINYLPEPEAPARFAKALVLLAKALAAVRGKTSVMKEELGILSRISLACIPSRRLAVLNALAAVEKGTTKAISLTANIATSSGKLILEDLMYLGAVDRSTKTDAETSPFYWALKPEAREEFAFVRSLAQLNTQKQQGDIGDIGNNVNQTGQDGLSVVLAYQVGPSDDPSTWPTCASCGRKVPEMDSNGLCPDCQALEVEYDELDQEAAPF
ncbi:MAG: hypothetical protein J7J22_00010 [Candidatus Verstraetearchaeota archaeon]|nr:hypothetical protein [Candidatus Verstraetearchaeota archaeon]